MSNKKCELCNFNFPSKRDLKTHISLEHRVPCDYCNKKFFETLDVGHFEFHAALKYHSSRPCQSQYLSPIYFLSQSICEYVNKWF